MERLSPAQVRCELERILTGLRRYEPQAGLSAPLETVGAQLPSQAGASA